MSVEVNGEVYLDTKEATKLLGISRAKLNLLVRQGKVKQYRQPVRENPIYKETELRKLLEVTSE